MVSLPTLSNIMGRGLDHSIVAIQTSQFSQLLCPEFFLLHHNTVCKSSNLLNQTAAEMESEEKKLEK
jgi:hypothetical protein